MILTCPVQASAELAAKTAPLTEPRPLGETLQNDAKSVYQMAQLLVQDGDYQGAATKFQHAYQLDPDPRLLWNIAACEKEQRHYARAVAAIERYLAAAGASLSASNKASAIETLEALRTLTSLVTLTGAPANARVTVDGEFVGALPLVAPFYLDLGQRHLLIEAEGFESWKSLLDISGNAPLSLNVHLIREHDAAALRIVSTNPNDTIQLDGKVVGRGKFDGQVKPGSHRVLVSGPGKQSYQLDFELRAGSSRTLQVTLEEAPKKRSPWPWVIGGALLAAGAATGGYFVLSNNGPEVQGPTGSLGHVDLPPSQ